MFAVLASWFRLKYPHVTIGALASSAPILQFDYITPWTSFYDAVSQNYKVLVLNSIMLNFLAKYFLKQDWNSFFLPGLGALCAATLHRPELVL